MRESEEYLDDNCTYTDSDCWVLHEDAHDAVKLAYKEGCNETLDKVKALIDDLFGAYVPWEMIEFEVEFNKLRKNE
jgi:hypothetical protein